MIALYLKKQFVQAMQKNKNRKSFLSVTVRNISGFNEDELLKISIDFFGLSQESKMEIAKQVFNPKNSNIFRFLCIIHQISNTSKEIWENSRNSW